MQAGALGSLHRGRPVGRQSPGLQASWPRPAPPPGPAWASSGPPPPPQDEEQPRQHQRERETCEPGQPLRRHRKQPKGLGPFALQGSWQRASRCRWPTFPLTAQSAQALALSGTQAHAFRAHLPLHEHPTSRLTLAGAGQQLVLTRVSLAPQPHVDGSWFAPSLSVPLLRLAGGHTSTEQLLGLTLPHVGLGSEVPGGTPNPRPAQADHLMTGGQPPRSLGFPSSLPEPHRTRTGAICRNPRAADECTAVSSRSSDWSSDCLTPPSAPLSWNLRFPSLLRAEGAPAPLSCRATPRGAGILLRKRTLSPACGFSFRVAFHCCIDVATSNSIGPCLSE